MAERKKTKASISSPLATVEEIQRRLVRPSSTSISMSPQPTSTISSPEEVHRRRKAYISPQFQLRTTKKLEDYLDSALLAQISSKLSRAKKVPETRPQKKEVSDFEWPIEKLKVLVDSEKEAVNLKDDLDQVEQIGDDNSRYSYTPFRRFEQIASRRFKERRSQFANSR